MLEVSRARCSTAQSGAPRPDGERGAEQQIVHMCGMPTTRAMLSNSYSRQDASLTAHESLSYITLGNFGVAASWWHFSGARGVCCCSSTSLSLARVSTPSTLSPRVPAPMPCAHLRATLRFRSRLLPHTLMCATHGSLSQGHICARRRAAKPQDGSRHRIDYCDDRLRQPRGP